MFVQATRSRRKNKTYLSYLVREAFRTPQGPRSRTVCNISGLPAPIRQLLTSALAGKNCLPVEDIALTQALNYGGLAVLREAWQRFGLAEFFTDLPNPRHRALLQAMIFGRILFPCAKLALYDQARKSSWRWRQIQRALPFTWRCCAETAGIPPLSRGC